ncbi:MAG: nuclear transport factor 2 family protein [Saprospiraceae bacterium]|nr:nuclear transport factor 2 family protein [Saprospiraceae bacterium]
MTTKEIANRLVELLRQGQFETAQKELFAPDAISVEPAFTGQAPTEGINAIVENGVQFRASVEAWHGLSVSEAVSSANHISLALLVEATMKGQGRITMDEIIVYKVQDGKIVHEQFFY